MFLLNVRAGRGERAWRQAPFRGPWHGREGHYDRERSEALVRGARRRAAQVLGCFDPSTWRASLPRELAHVTTSHPCAGDNRQGQLGYGDRVTRGARGDVHVDLGTGRTARKLFPVSNQATCALLDNGQTKCWGESARSPRQARPLFFALRSRARRVVLFSDSRHVFCEEVTSQVPGRPVRF